ncbi:uncharacterized protein LOC110861167 isoform X2 [Folsomia candida]|uniref:uncharacterized protein LOC110861167 isoform X2 n=1 Tax=Folsomia candida TaxID=158441 RepID=UPI000B8F089E|nr:uncharacterized protein LOC110861167 isoform X2 [Folsomia candida]
MSGRDCCLFCGTDSNISTRMGNDRSRSLHVISILHKLLQIPIWECGKYLDFPSPSSSSSPPPGTDWLILCTSCSSMVAHGHDLVQQLDRIQNKLGIIQTTLLNQIAKPQKKVMTKTKAKIFNQLKRDISRRTGPLDTNRLPNTRHGIDISSYERQGSIDDMNLDVLVEEIKIEHPEINLDYDDDLSPDVEMEAEDGESMHFIESGDDEEEEADTHLEDQDETKVRKPRKCKKSKNEQRVKLTTRKKRPKIGESGPEDEDLNLTEGRNSKRNNNPPRLVKPLIFEKSKYTQYFEKVSPSGLRPKSSKTSTTKDQVRCTLPVKDNETEICSETLTLQERSYSNLVLHLKRKHELNIDQATRGSKARLISHTGDNNL